MSDFHPGYILNAIIYAVSHLGVTSIEKPASPERVWRAIHATNGPGGGA